MSEKEKQLAGDRGLGMQSSITRRDFLGSSLLASGAMLMGSLTPSQLLAMRDAWTGYGGVGEYANSNGNTWDVMTLGHKMRDGDYDPLPASAIDTGEIFDCVVVGGGISGLAASVLFCRQAGKSATCLVLDDHPIFGGEAKQNVFEVDGKRLISHQGSAIYFVQYPHSFLAQFYDSIGLHQPRLAYQKWSGSGPEMSIGRTPYDSAGMATGQYGFWFGADFGNSTSSNRGVLLVDPVGKKFAGAPVAAGERSELLRWFSGKAAGEAPFPSPKYEGDDVSRKLDSITLEQHYIDRFGLSREFIRKFLSPDLGSGSGLGADALSAYSDYAAELLHPYEGEGEFVQMFPGGNTTIARLLVKSLIPASIDGSGDVESVSRDNVNFAALDSDGSPARIRLRATVVSVQHDGAPDNAPHVLVAYEQGGKVYRLKARSVVVAGGSWTARHIIKDLPAAHKNAYAQFYRSPCLMASIALRNWRPLAKLGITGCRWFSGIGNYVEIRRLANVGIDDPTISPDSPIVLTLKVLYSYPGLSTENQGHRGRGEMLATSFRDYERRIRAQFSDMFSSAGFDAQRDIAGIILNRWGHAYLSPQPGFFFGANGQPAPRDLLRGAPFGRIAFANTDLAGAMDHRFSILEAQRAVGQLLDQVLVS